MPIELDPEGRELTALLELLPNLHCARVVEVGCGDGRLTRRYADHAASVLAFDPDEAAIVAFRSDRLPDRVEVPQRCDRSHQHSPEFGRRRLVVLGVVMTPS